MKKQNGNEIKVTVNRKKSSNDIKDIRALVDRAIAYARQSSGSDNFMGSISQRDGNSRPVSYTYEKPAIFNDPLSLSDIPAPVGAGTTQRGV